MEQMTGSPEECPESRMIINIDTKTRRPSILRRDSLCHDSFDFSNCRKSSASSGYSSGSSSPDSVSSYRKHRRTVTFHQDLFKDIKFNFVEDYDDEDKVLPDLLSGINPASESCLGTEDLDDIARVKAAERAQELPILRDVLTWLAASLPLSLLTPIMEVAWPAKVDDLTVNFLDRLEQTFPVLKEPTDTVLEHLKQGLSTGYYEPVREKIHKISHAMSISEELAMVWSVAGEDQYCLERLESITRKVPQPSLLFSKIPGSLFFTP